MKKIKNYRHEQIENLIRERENYTNKSNCRVMMAIMCCIIIIMVLCRGELIPFHYHLIGHMLAGISVIIMATGLAICMLGKYNRNYHKYIVIFSLVLSAAILYAAIGYDSVGYFLMPLLLSGRYGSNKMCIITYGVSIMLNGSAGFAYAWLDSKYFHTIDWSANPESVFLGLSLPLLLITTVMAIVVFGMVHSDKKSIRQIVKARAQSAKREAEFEMGAELQMNSLSKNFNMAPDNEFALYASLISSKETSGDFYDFFIAGDGRAVFVIGDVSDKGVPAALYMMSARNTVRALCRVMNNPADIMTEANRMLLETSDEAFVTLFIAFVDLETGAGEYVNAGHEPPIIQFANKSSGFLSAEPQPIAGAFDFVEYKSSPLQMEKGSLMFLYTDGINESINSQGEEFGIDRLNDMIRASDSNGPEDICKDIEAAIDEFANDAMYSDDRTMLAVRWDKETGIYEKKTLPVGYESISEMVNSVNELLQINGCPENTIRNIDVAIDEMGANLVEYSQADTLEFEYECGNRHIRLIFTDNGIPFNPEHSNVHETRETLTLGGLGLHFVRSLMDEVCYGYENEHNVITMTKYWE